MTMRKFIDIISEAKIYDFPAHRKDKQERDAKNDIETARTTAPQWKKDYRPYKEINKPQIGDTVVMDFDDSVIIEITDVPDAQPYADRGVWVIIDQYDEEHEVEKDGDTWLTVNPWSDI